MAHHSTDPFEEPERLKKMEALKKKFLDTASFRGAIGDFPEGHLTKTDEGSIQFALGVKDGKVVLDFGTPVAWLGMTPQQATDLASLLVKQAREAARETGQSVSFTIV